MKPEGEAADMDYGAFNRPEPLAHWSSALVNLLAFENTRGNLSSMAEARMG